MDRAIYTSRSFADLARRRPLVVVYHRIAPATSDRWSLAVSPAVFERQLRALRRFFRPVSLTALLDALADGDARGCVAVTFDDGYADNLSTALPLLEKYAVPATFFISSDAVERGREFWWDDLERMSDLAPDDAWSFFSDWSGEPVPHDEPSRYLVMWRALSAIPGERRDEFLDRLRERIGLSASPRETHRPLTPEELRRIASSQFVEIGAHGRSHSNLAFLPAADQIEEVEGGKEAVERMSGRRATLFAYPFGKPDAFSEATGEAVRNAGFRAAFTTVSAAIPSKPDLFQLPRCNATNVSGLRFIRLLLGAMSRRPLA